MRVVAGLQRDTSKDQGKLRLLASFIDLSPAEYKWKAYCLYTSTIHTYFQSLFFKMQAMLQRWSGAGQASTRMPNWEP